MKKLLLVFLAVMLFGLSSKAISNAAFIYNTDLTDAQSFETFLEANGFAVTLIPIANTATTDYTGYNVIITSAASILSQTQADAIKALNKPIIGLGGGGYRSLGLMGLDIGTPNGMSGNENKMFVENATLTVFNSPIDITINTGDSIQLFTGLASASPARMIYVPTPKASIEGLLRFRPLYYAVIRQHGKYTFWGFTLSPASMTQNGKDLFVNVIADAIVTYSITALPKTNTLNEPTLQFNSQTKQLTVTGVSGDMELSVVDLSGKTLINSQLQNQINLLGLNKGVYVVKIKSANTVISKKFIY